MVEATRFFSNPPTCVKYLAERRWPGDLPSQDGRRKSCRMAVATGKGLSDLVACAATLFKSGHGEINDAAEAALALKPFAAQFASLLFGVGLVNASVLSAAILPLPAAYNVCEGMGFESGVDNRFSEAKVFYSLYTFLIVLGAGAVLIPNMPLLKVILLSQVANGVLIPFVLIFMLVLVNRGTLMGEMRNRTWQNIVAWTTAVVMIVLTAMMLWSSLTGA
jgi:Mn2+/Fe2+ NRAMP family transporter